MIYFDLSSRADIIQEHRDSLKPYLLRKIRESNLNRLLKDFIESKLEDILVSKPEDLKNINDLLLGHRAYKNALKPKIKKIFNYKYFTAKGNNRYDAYTLAAKLQIRTCLYCNRNYTLTVDKGSGKDDKFIRPEFDHFFDQDDYPLLALSVYNLIPSCKTCNSTLKHTAKFKLSENIHPYVDDVISDYNYQYLPYTVSAILGGSAHLGVKLIPTSTDAILNQRIENSCEIFRLNEIFSAHSEELKDMFDIRHRFSQRYLIELVGKYEKLDFDYDDIYRIVFGTYSKEADFSKRPFSKVKKDILIELGIL